MTRPGVAQQGSMAGTIGLGAPIEATAADGLPAEVSPRRAEGGFPARIDLSGRLFLIVLAVVLLIEGVAAAAAIVQYRRMWLSDRSAEARIAAVAVTLSQERSVAEDRIRSVLEAIGARAIAAEIQGGRRVLGPPMEAASEALRIDPVEEDMAASLGAATRLLFSDSPRSIWVVGQTLASHPSAHKVADHRLAAIGAADAVHIDRVDVLVDEAPLRDALRDFAAQLLVAGLSVAVAAAGLVYLVVQRSVVRPVLRLARNIGEFANDPEGIDRNILPSRRNDEIGRAETALARMQWSLAGELRERRRLAGLGLSVSKINHELRNLLTTAQLLGDRLEGVADPVVQRVAPRLIATLDRAIRFCESTLAYGRATEPYPQRRHVALAPLLEEMEDLAGLSLDDRIRIETRAEPDLSIYVDPEQFSRALTNIVRNAVQALDAAGTQDVSPLVTITAQREAGPVIILLADNGPGLPESAQATLFAPFQGSMRAGGTGLGLAIASELVRLNGGTLDLDKGTSGACFRIVLPDKPAEGRPA